AGGAPALGAHRGGLGAMRTVDRVAIRAPVERVFAAARDVERWPAILSHYRRVRFLERRPDGGVVEMAAWRPFGPVRYPAWWVSDMTIRPEAREVRYRHVRGITRGMDVVWRLAERDGAVDVEIVHEWAGPAWPLIGRLAAALVIGPVFVHGIASRTLAGLKRFLEGSE
ncbi:MAG: type II toxin-antitoxin system RatA family toxin, partial [Gemmatimonadales bacterium]